MIQVTSSPWFTCCGSSRFANWRQKLNTGCQHVRLVSFLQSTRVWSRIIWLSDYPPQRWTGQLRRAGPGLQPWQQPRPVVRRRNKIINARIVEHAGIRRSKTYLMANIRKQKLLQLDIERELEGLTFEELAQIAMLINEFYSKSNNKPTIILNVFNYLK